MTTHLASPSPTVATVERRTVANIGRNDPERAALIRRGDVANMNVAEAATYLDVSVATLRRSVEARRITCIRLGGRLLFRKSDLDRDLARLAVPSI